MVNSGEIAHMSHGDTTKPLIGEEMGDKDLNVYSKGLGILVEDGLILSIADSDELISEYASSWDRNSEKLGDMNIIDANGGAIVPGFVDSHTHLIWDGDRSNEMALRQRGLTYSDISKLGGGISKTVESTRSCTIEKLVELGLQRASNALRLGTTTMEAKSGYGLSTESEIKLLEATERVNQISACDIQATWLGAHDIPKNNDKEEYIEELIGKQLSMVVQQGIAKWADVFCEPGWFTVDDTIEIITASKKMGLESRIHADEFVDSGGLDIAVELGSISADHVAKSDDDSRARAHESGVMQTFLPGTQYVLGMDEFPPMKKCVENSWAFSIASDFNPNCNTISMPFVGSLATHRCGIDPITALAASTRNPSTTLKNNENINFGVISENNSASFNILHSKKVESWCQSPGMNPISKTVANGIIVKHN
ncbi:MAG TPA: imidazolonepropionase [Candidatus Poseidoniales archaeon]|nr:MAG TPA: imidazolonepropionase [Candidatus Poseidoniales archaeon]